MNFVKLLLMLTLVLAACTPIQPEGIPPAAPTTPPSVENTPASTTESPQEPVTEGNLMGTQWILESYGPAGAETAVIGETPLTLEFSHEGQVIGHGGCNSFGTSYQVEDNTLVLGDIVSTLMACADSAMMEQELQYFEALQTVSTFELEEDRLTITYDQGVLNFSLIAVGTVMATPTPAPEASAPTTGTDTAVTQPESAGTSQDFVWHCFGCGGNQVWIFENGQASQAEIPIDIGVYYDYALTTDRILYGSAFPTQGGGPGMVSVTDLWTFDMESEQTEPLFGEEVIVEAEWAPNGEQSIYVLATEETYELRLRTPDGEDTLLASDVAFTFSISPNGEQVAFTRESAYEVGGQPGFYVADIASGEETMLSDFDRAGMGSIEDKPVWSPSGEHVLFSTHGITDSPGMLLAAADGSEITMLQFDPSLSNEEWFETQPLNAIWIEDTQLVGTILRHGPDTQLGGEPTVVLFELIEELTMVVDGAVLAEGMLVDSDVPGASIWVQVGGEMQSIPLPTL